MRRWVPLLVGLSVIFGIFGCGSEEDPEDTGNPWDDSDTNDTGNDDVDYLCLDDTEPVDEEACGPYPEHDNEMWDMLAVVPNMDFKAYYDRDCDGEPELTTLRMYEDVYCQRDTIKSLVLAVGSNCGSGEGS